MKKILVLLAHDDLGNSLVNRRIKEELSCEENILYKDLNELYPDFNIDVKKEQEDLKNISKIVFQFPMYWYSAPALLKRWVDTVLEYGFSFIINEKGEFEALALKDKEFQTLISMGAKEESFYGEDRLSVKECLNSYFYTMKMLGTKEKESVFIYGSEYDDITEEKLQKHLQEVKEKVLKK